LKPWSPSHRLTSPASARLPIRAAGVASPKTPDGVPAAWAAQDGAVAGGYEWLEVRGVAGGRPG
jgi:hypothetical protein